MTEIQGKPILVRVSARFELAGGSSYRGFEFPRVKLSEIQGKSILVRVSVRFELVRV